MRKLFLMACLLIGGSALAADSSVATLICEVVRDAGERAQCVERATALVPTGTIKVSEGSGIPWLSMLWPVGWWVIYYAFGLLIGGYIYRDASNREWLFLGIRPLWWVVLPVFDTTMGILVYWALHYSKFAQSYHEASASTSSAAPIS